ncbi:hypothetical protein [Streptomyces sp. 1222.5]|uniref:hypothetical protein n=1 Tax=Streptomyces sp. 1222.5 TaxID=1881026 RepID=UPI003EC0B909
MDRNDRPPVQHSPNADQGAGHFRGQLLTMADRLDHDPERPADLTLTPAGQLEVATDVSGGSPDFIDLIPTVTGPTTRGAYAARLRQIAGVR